MFKRRLDFVIGGVQKGGTTALDAYLRAVPGVQMARNKEPHYFDRSPNNIVARALHYGKYQYWHLPSSDGNIVGEATPILSYWESAPRRIWEYNPEIKWILLLRNPAERAYSHWNMERKRGVENREFGDAIRHERSAMAESLPLQSRSYSYVDRGYYSEQIRRIARFFSWNQMLVMKSEELRNNHEQSISRVFDFLGVQSPKVIQQQNIHVGNYAKTMLQTDRKYLIKLFDAEITTIERMLNWNCDEWRLG